ncbi:MAG: polyprenyl synthetase family protein [Methanocellales archaeon]|nr:polyprenyl synthetase family protein [Methanocellales archaeon]MDD3290943.1 polyprenyl synthetase family protein [Methanocellales archaeon]MDD5234828.1 polyprenyl synthetase family protein [Methanocellales archaeon]MDD5484802.1 polyprenyl synthetase family protein [Methanocellales archaeon]
MDRLLEEYTELIDHKLREYFKTVLEEGRAYHPFIGDVFAQVEEFLLRKGKRIASCSTLLTYKGYTGEIEDILDICVGIELYRHGILIHDDLVDRDEKRRGGEAFHKLFTYGDRFGESMAVFYGNILFSQALRTLFESNFECIGKVIKLFLEDYKAVNESQTLDLLFEHKEPTVEEWYVMASKRAASLFKASMLTGAILGGASAQDLQILEEAAMHIGYSFDIQDDIIGTFASEEQYGRATGGDILLGKKPLHMVYAYKLAKGDLQQELRNIAADAEGIEKVKKIIKECGALAKTKEVSRDHASRAIKLINKTSMNAESKNFFKDLIDFVTESLDWYSIG